MFSLTCAVQNQLFPLSQLLSTVSCRQNVASSRTLVRPKKTVSVELEISQPESLSPISRLVADLPRDDITYLLEKISPVHKQIRAGQTPLFESHVSATTFFENKYGFHEKSLSTTPSVLLFQARGFKTYRGDISFQGPTVTDRLKSKFQARRVAIGGLQSGLTKEKQKGLAEIEHNEKLKNLLSSEQLSSEEQSRVKVAFAEGYLAADTQKKTSKTTKALKLFQNVLITVALIAILLSFFGSLGGSVFRVSVGNGNQVSPEEINISFDDVKGVEEAKTELQEIVEFLKTPEKFSALGGKLPKGVLLVGPPGTGKTMLARAVAGEAGVPFFHAAGPEFDEILVGQGARRVRDLFKAAKMRAPCVIFIDEIDSVGAKRTNSVLHPYANQTINQLLTEMDGFHQNEGVIVLGATNRRDDLDKALLRPGRFDVEVKVPIPDFTGRKEILDHYLRKIKLASDVDVESLARRTTGFTGADLENLVNQAAVRGAIDGAHFVTMKHLEHARDRVLMGPERKSRIPDEEANLITAYHEGGHTIVAHYTKEASPLHKVTIIPRGQALGHTAFIPEKESYYVNKSQLLARIDVAMGGRAAEELIFGPDKITAGAASDLKSATAIATYMVKEWGMSEKVGFRTHENESNSLVVVNDLSPQTADVIDSEIKAILQDSYERAKSILRLHQQEHKMLAEALLKYETLDAEDVKAILNSTKNNGNSSSDT